MHQLARQALDHFAAGDFPAALAATKNLDLASTEAVWRLDGLSRELQ